jgi:hypothetical protein
VASLFIADAKVLTSLPPFASVRGDTFASGPGLGEQMSQLMQERSFDFFRAMIDQERVQRNQPAAVIGAPRAAR